MPYGSGILVHTILLSVLNFPIDSETFYSALILQGFIANDFIPQKQKGVASMIAR